MRDPERDRQLEHLLHTINHDLRAPLGNIRSALSILQQDLSDPLTDDQRTFVEIIEHSTTRLLDQSNRLMLFSQITFTDANLEPTQLSEVFANTKQALKSTYEIDTVTFQADGDPIINCNQHTLSPILAMLAAGNIKYQPDQTQNKPPAISTQMKDNEIWFTIHSLMPTHELAPSLIELASEVIQRHGGSLENGESNEQKEFIFGIPLLTTE